MTKQEYEVCTERVRCYSELKSDIERLEQDKNCISNGILSITSFYQHEIDCFGRYDGFQEGVRDALIRFYDTEIGKLEQKLSDL